MPSSDEVEVGLLSDSYERALLHNDVDAMNASFWESDAVVRYGIADMQYGYDEVVAWRAQALPVNPLRQIMRKTVASLGPDVVAVDLLFDDGDGSVTGRQSQTWVRRPEGWRIVRAHVSVVPNSVRQ
ncbi:MAG: hypothetical protein RLZZ623_1091 [Actinomycetota bacterium]